MLGLLLSHCQSRQLLTVFFVDFKVKSLVSRRVVDAEILGVTSIALQQLTNESKQCHVDQGRGK